MATLKAQSAGGKATAIKSRKLALDRYYLNPNICKECGKIITVKDGHKIPETKKKKFCNHTCSALYRNKNRKKIRIRKPKSTLTEILSSKTKGDLFSNQKWQNARSKIQRNARNNYKASDKPKKCNVCGYSKHYEVAHIKSVADFSSETLISEINDLTNLVALCPNHHWEFDNLENGSESSGVAPAVSTL